jgi:hypothetical protein
MPVLGDPIRLNLQLWDGATSKFPLAVLRDGLGNELPESPIGLSHIGDGLYADDSVDMPDTPEVTATYVVYNDAGFTDESDEHQQSLDVFPLNTITPLLEQVLELLEKCLNTNMIACIDSANEIIGLLKGVDGIDAYVSEESIFANIDNDDTIKGTLNDENLEGLL